MSVMVTARSNDRPEPVHEGVDESPAGPSFQASPG